MRNLPVHRRCAALSLGLVLVSVTSAGVATGAGRADRKISSDLESMLAGGSSPRIVDVIVQSDGASLESLRAHLRGHGATVGRDLALVGGVAASMPASELEAASLDSRVRRVSPDRPLFPAMDVAAAAAGDAWSRSLTPSAGGPTGLGVGVAVIDSGVYPHEDLAGALVASVDFVDPTRQGSALTQDPYGHGTHVAGIIAGRPVESPGHDGFLGGVAPDARLVSLRVLDHKGVGRSSDVIAAIEWSLRHRADYGIRVLNLSLGQPVAEPAADDPLDQAVERAWREGLVVVTAAGNAGAVGSGYGMISSPANDPLVIAVGALDDRGTAQHRDDDMAFFSSRGPSRFDFTLKPDVVAPGTRIVSLRAPHSTLDRLLPDARVFANSLGSSPALDPRYFELSGSSMAAALVSGAAAVMLEADPSLTPDDVKARLMRHADHLAARDIYTRGAGAIDVAAALAGTERAGASPSPSVAISAATGEVAFTDTAAAWGDPSLFALTDLYGDAALWNEEVARTLSLFENACMIGQGVIWQHARANGVIWQHAVAEGIIWQTLTGEGLTWQHLTGSGLTWQHSLGDGSCPY